MKVFSAKVVSGRLDVADADVPDGATVTVLVDDDTTVDLTDAQRALLRRSIAQADSGETVDAWESLKDLRQ